MGHLKSPMDRASDNQISLFIFLAGLVLFTTGLQHQSFVGFETRFALFAKEMLRHGPSFFPTTYGKPYPDYPATATLLIYWLALPFGDVGRLVAAMPTALASAATLALSYKLLAPLSKRWAFFTVCFELLTFTFLAEARALSLDQMVATITLAAFYLVYNADREQYRHRLKFLPLLFLGGFALRGPLGLVIPTSVVCSYYALSGQWRRLLVTGSTALLVLSAAWSLLLLVASREGGNQFVADVVRMQVSGRLEATSDLDHGYYFTHSFGNYALAWPVACLVILLVAHRFPERKNDPQLALLFFMVGWILVVALGLSIPHTKKARYLLPVVPALAAIAAYPFIARNDRLMVILRRALHAVLLWLPGLVLIGLLFGRASLHKKGIDPNLPWLPALSALLLWQIAAVTLQMKSRVFAYREMGVAACAVLALWTGKVFLVEPALRHIYDTQSFVHSVEQLRNREPAPLAFYAMGKDARAIKYMVNLDYNLTPRFYDRVVELTETGALYIVAPATRNAELKAAGAGAPIFKGRFDNEEFCVFYRKSGGPLSAQQAPPRPLHGPRPTRPQHLNPDQPLSR